MRGRKLEQARFIVYSTAFKKALDKELRKVRDYIKEHRRPLRRGFWKDFDAIVDKFYEDTARLYAKTFTYEELKYFYEMISSNIGSSVYLKTVKLAPKGYDLGNKLSSDLVNLS